MQRMVYIILAMAFSVIPLISEASNTWKIPQYRLTVNVDVENNILSGKSQIDVDNGPMKIHTGELIIKSVKLDGNILPFTIRDGFIELNPSKKGVLSIEYKGIFREVKREVDPFNHGVLESIINQKSIFLTGTWYPLVHGLFIYRLTAILPAGYHAVSEAEDIDMIKDNTSWIYSFDFPYPLNHINLIASKDFEITKKEINRISIYTYFFPEERELKDKYIQHAIRFIELYEGMFGSFPYKRFSIVENFLQTGYSMPGLTVLGSDVVKLPFIVETYLGHEILHQWFGNYVFVDYEKGNWAKGLVTYLSDHLYESGKDKDREYRKRLLIDYRNYVNPENEISLREFRERIDFSTKAIGYGKSMMVFYMLKNIIGDEVFFKSLRAIIERKRFKKVSWDDIKTIFEEFSGKDLGDFFKQWIDEKGLPSLSIENEKVRISNGRFEVSFDIIQKNKTFIIDIPVEFHLRGSTVTNVINIKKERERFTFFFDDEPLSLVIDRDYSIPRELTEKELPPVISGIIGAKRVLLSVPPEKKEIYKMVVDVFRDKEIIEVDQDMRTTDGQRFNPSDYNIIILDRDNPLIKRLFGSHSIIDAGFSITVKKNPFNLEKVIALIDASSINELELSLRKIFHYGGYSQVVFEGGRNVSKSIEGSTEGINITLRREPPVVELSKVKTMEDIIERILLKKVIFIGEFHDRFSNHLVQLEIIKSLVKKGRKIAIGMEMFQRPFQNVLDDYINGKIDEIVFLRKTEYFKRWGFDYNLYKPILDFARKNRIPVIALNQKKEIIDKVSREGIESLTEDEKKEIPPDTDFSDMGYQERLREIFRHHTGGRDFKNFYQSQILWDETMASTLIEFLSINNDYQMVVLAGGGHIMYGFGIPKRVKRRGVNDIVTILIDSELIDGIADYVIIPEPIDGMVSPKLMVSLSVSEKGIMITDFPQGSISKKAGLKKGDVILSLDDNPVKTIEDIKIHLFYKKPGDSIKVKVKRRIFLFGERIIEYEFRLPGD